MTLNRPHRHNAYNDELIDAMLSAIDEIKAKQPLAVVLRGEGRSFQSGADLDWIQSLRELDSAANLHASTKTASAISGINTLTMPVLCLVHGSCFGGGTGIAAACDFVVAVDGTQFAIAEVKWGLSPGIILPLLLDAVGYRNLRRYALTAEQFDAKVARDIGLVHEITASWDQANAVIARMVEQICENDPAAVSETKSTLAEFQTSASDYDELIAEHSRRRLSNTAARGLARFRGA